MLKV
ncbi:Prohormone convertase 2, partial [Danaus plexippus plexippus]|jgi:copper chaperone CopZ